MQIWRFGPLTEVVRWTFYVLHVSRRPTVNPKCLRHSPVIVATEDDIRTDEVEGFRDIYPTEREGGGKEREELYGVATMPFLYCRVPWGDITQLTTEKHLPQ